MRLPFIGVGLLYRQGYFSQTIDAEGNQRAEYRDSEFDSLPVTPVLRAGRHRSARARRSCPDGVSSARSGTHAAAT